MNKELPRVSVVMSVYNGEKYLREAIDSILNQTFKDFEFIIINDGSTDKTQEILDTYKDPRIVRINQDNMGLTKALNKGIAAARGRYIARQDADDISLPERLERQIDFMDNHPEVGVLGTGFQLISEDGARLEAIDFPGGNDLILWHMHFYNPIVHPTVMMRRDIVNQVKGYNAEVLHAQDYELWCRLCGIIKFANLQGAYLWLRKHKDNISLNALESQTRYAVSACRKLISGQLGQDVPDNIVHALWTQKFKDSKEALEAAKIIYKLYRLFAQKSLSSGMMSLIKKDVSVRLSNLAKASPGVFYSWRINLLLYLVK